MNKKKEIEKHHLVKFVSNKKMRLLVNRIEDSETPDFILHFRDKKISLEHRRLINPKLKQIESYKEKIINKARIRFEEKYNEELYLLITFNNILLEGGSKAEQKYIDEVFRLVEDIYLSNRNFDFQVESKQDVSQVSELIESFTVSNILTFVGWQHFGSYLVDWIDMKWLQDVIDKKENNIKKYPEKYNEDWLLLVSDFGTKSSAHRFDRIDFSKIQTRFDKVYLYSFSADEVEIIK